MTGLFMCCYLSLYTKHNLFTAVSWGLGADSDTRTAVPVAPPPGTRQDKVKDLD